MGSASDSMTTLFFSYLNETAISQILIITAFSIFTMIICPFINILFLPPVTVDTIYISLAILSCKIGKIIRSHYCNI